MVEPLVVSSDRLHVTLHFRHLWLLLLNITSQAVSLIFSLRQTFL